MEEMDTVALFDPSLPKILSKSLFLCFRVWSFDWTSVLSFPSLVPLPGVFPFLYLFVCLFVLNLSLCFGSYHVMLHTIIVY